MRLRSIFLALITLGAASQAHASAAAVLETYPAAKVAIPALGVPVGVRAIGMGEAYTAAGGDVSSLHWNPAGLARIGGYQLGLMHNEWSSALGLRQEYLAYGMSLGQASGLGLAFNYFSLGTLTERSATGAAGQESGAFAFAGTLGWGLGMLRDEKLKLGVAAEFGQESLFKTGSSAFGGSVGLLYDLNRNFSGGLSVVHLGAGAGGFSPPTQANLGLAYAFKDKAAVLALDGSLPFSGTPGAHAGAELNYGGASLRGGWRQAFGAPDGDVSSGFTAGAGFKAGVFAIDYAFVPYGSISTTHRLAATIELPADFFKPKIIGADSSTMTARTYYDKAVNQEKDGNLLQALVYYQRAKDAYPEKMIAQKKTQNFYLTSVRKIDAIQKEMAKSGNNEPMRKLVAKTIADGQEHLRERRYKDAIRRFRDAIGLDGDNKQAKDLLEEAQVALRGRKRELLKAAESAYDGGQLGSAILKYREVLSIDEGDADAQAFFSTHQAEVMENLRKIHRKGIDLYVSGKIKEAIAQWKEGLRLDPADPIKYRRDIEKAEKVLEVRGGR